MQTLNLLKYYILILTVFTLFSCNSNDKNINSFYIWKAELQLTNSDFTFLKNNKVSNLYIRLFDVTWNEEAIPQSILNFSGEIPTEFNIIPAIFIDNDVLKNIKIEQIDDFANKLNTKINKIYSKYFFNHKITEIQLDCDWTESTRDKYFKLLKVFQQKIVNNIELSVTIRLHQVKYKQSCSIPPVKKGTLMYYNMGDLKNFYEKNSILNNQIGQQYINKNTKYPLDLSLALPLYSWGVWFDWHGFANVIYSINVNTKDKLDYLQKNSENNYKVVKDTFIEENYLRIGDFIRIETIDLKELENAEKICRPLLKNNFELILYSYNFGNTNLLNNHDLEKIYLCR